MVIIYGVVGFIPDYIMVICNSMKRVLMENQSNGVPDTIGAIRAKRNGIVNAQSLEKVNRRNL
jgi:hypothetical protein